MVTSVKRFHMGLSLTSKGTAHDTSTFVVLPVNHGRRCFETIQHSVVCTPQPQSPKPTKVRSSRGIGETRIGMRACCRHSRMSLFASRVSATVSDACATLEKRRTHTEIRTSLVSQPVRRTRHSSKLSQLTRSFLVSVCSRTSGAKTHTHKRKLFGCATSVSARENTQTGFYSPCFSVTQKFHDPESSRRREHLFENLCVPIWCFFVCGGLSGRQCVLGSPEPGAWCGGLWWVVVCSWCV